MGTGVIHRHRFAGLLSLIPASTHVPFVTGGL